MTEETYTYDAAHYADNVVYRGYTMDFTAQLDYARRPDGQWFTRCQNRTIYGYRWTAWRQTTAPWKRLSGAGYGRNQKARLPK